MEIKVENVLMRYKSNEVLNIRELEFKQGFSYGLVGHNGAGKTTLFKCITNIICDYTGNIYINDIAVKENNGVLSKVGIVLDGMSVYKNRSGWFNIKYFAGLRGSFDEKKAQDLAYQLDIVGVLGNNVKTYSYGMQKKLILLIALMNTPELLILDEPFRGLDVESVKWFKKYLKELTTEGMTLLISSHVQNDLETLCDEVYVIDHGRIIDNIDLNLEKEKKLRVLDTENNTRLIELLDTANYNYQITEDNSLKLDISDERWLSISKQLQTENIEINEMSKVKILEDKLN